MGRKKKILQKVSSLVICFVLIFQQTGFSQVVGQVDISGYITGMMNHAPTDAFRPAHLRYFSYDSQDNSFKVLVDKGDYLKEVDSRQKSVDSKKNLLLTTDYLLLNNETQKLLQYFLVGVSLEDESFWVNLRPVGARRAVPANIIDPLLEKTDVGRIMLEADLQLKKDTALYTSPQTKEGREYWNKLYKKAEELYGTETVDIPTLTRPWIVPGEIIIRETNEAGSLKIEDGKKIMPSAYIYKASLKVMLEEDYLKDSNQKPVTSNQNIVVADLGRQNNGRASSATTNDPRLQQLNTYSTQLIKELIIPKLTKEINSSKRYASLRQVYYSLILARWFKKQFDVGDGLAPSRNNGRPQGSPLHGAGYTHLINSRNLTGLTSQTPWSKDTYFKQYQKSFAEGEYSIKEQISGIGSPVIRTYFSGGMDLANINSSCIIQGSSLRVKQALTKDLIELFIEGEIQDKAFSSAVNKPLNSDQERKMEYFAKKRIVVENEVTLGTLVWNGWSPVKAKTVKNPLISEVSKFFPNNRRAAFLAAEKVFKQFYRLDLNFYFLKDRDSKTIHYNGPIRITLAPGVSFLIIKVKDIKEFPVNQILKENITYADLKDYLLIHEGAVRVVRKGEFSLLRGVTKLSRVEAELRHTDHELLDNDAIADYQVMISLTDRQGDKIVIQDRFRDKEYGTGYFRPSGRETLLEWPIMMRRASDWEGIFRPFASPVASSGITAPGGIDFAGMQLITQAQTGIVGSEFNLPVLTPLELERINIDEELNQIKQMTQSEFEPNAKRMEELIAACRQKGQLLQKLDELVGVIVAVIDLEQMNNTPTAPVLTAALRFIEQY